MSAFTCVSSAPQAGEGSSEARTLLRARVQAPHLVLELRVRRPGRPVHAGFSLDRRSEAESDPWEFNYRLQPQKRPLDTVNLFPTVS